MSEKIFISLSNKNMSQEKWDNIFKEAKNLQKVMAYGDEIVIDSFKKMKFDFEGVVFYKNISYWYKTKCKNGKLVLHGKYVDKKHVTKYIINLIREYLMKKKSEKKYLTKKQRKRLPKKLKKAIVRKRRK